MAKSTSIVSYTAEELRAMAERGETQTDWARFDAVSTNAVEHMAADDPDDVFLTDEELSRGLSGHGDQFVRLDPDVGEQLPQSDAERDRIVNDILRAHFLTRADLNA